MQGPFRKATLGWGETKEYKMRVNLTVQRLLDCPVENRRLTQLNWHIFNLASDAHLSR
jgi:hypothetical protein